MLKRRHFVTSLTLKQAIQSYTHVFFTNHPGFQGDFYIFHHPTDPLRPRGYRWFHYFCKRTAQRAGMAEVAVHPHMFRHTIVGFLGTCHRVDGPAVSVDDFLLEYSCGRNKNSKMRCRATLNAGCSVISRLTVQSFNVKPNDFGSSKVTCPTL